MNTEKSLMLSMRRLIGFGLVLMCPLCLLWVKLFGQQYQNWAESFSMFYWNSSRPIYLVMLSITAIFNILYKGYDWKDRVLNITVGIALLVLVFIPVANPFVLNTNPDFRYNLLPNIPNETSRWIHRSATFVVIIGYVINILFLFTKNSGEITEKKRVRNIIYRVCGIGTIILFIFQTLIALQIIPVPSKFFIYPEVLTFILIGFCWLVKGEALVYFNDT